MSHGRLAAWRRLEHGFDAAFGAALNPLRHLGALGFLSFWLLAVSGIYLYAVFDTSAAGAYRSIDDLSRQQPWSRRRAAQPAPLCGRRLRDPAGRAPAARMAARPLPRHAPLLVADRRAAGRAGVRQRHRRLLAATGTSSASISAIATAEWIDALPFLAAPLARNFLSVDAVSDRLFSLFVFVHLGVPLLLVFALWFHIQRLTRAGVLPPRAAGAGPAGRAAGAGARARRWPATRRPTWPPCRSALRAGLDPAVHPPAGRGHLGRQLAWALALGGLAAAVRAAVPAAARALRRWPWSIAANCNGCRRCFADCPFAAITMVPHPNQQASASRWPRSMPTCARAAASASAPARRRRRFAAPPNWSPASTCRRRRSVRCAAAAAGHRGAAASSGRSSSSAATAARASSALAGARRRRLQPDLHRPAAAVLRRIRAARRRGRRAGQRPAAKAAASSASASAGPRSACSACASRTCAPRVPRERLETVWADNGDEARCAQALERLRERVRDLHPALGPRPKTSHV